MSRGSEKVFGGLIRANRVQRFECHTREVFCEKFRSELGGITPEVLRDMEDGNLVGTFDMTHMITMINFLWESKKVRKAMLIIAEGVEKRILAVSSDTVLDDVPVYANVRERVPRLPHRERL